MHLDLELQPGDDRLFTDEAFEQIERIEQGLLALERGEHRDTHPDFAYPRIADELTYGIRHKLFQNLSRETLTIRHSPRVAWWRRPIRVCPWAHGMGKAAMC